MRHTILAALLALATLLCGPAQPTASAFSISKALKSISKVQSQKTALLAQILNLQVHHGSLLQVANQAKFKADRDKALAQARTVAEAIRLAQQNLQNLSAQGR